MTEPHGQQLHHQRKETSQMSGPTGALASDGRSRRAQPNWRAAEIQAKRAIEDHGFAVHDANVLSRENCPNIDLVVFAKATALDVQVKSSQRPAGPNHVIIDGAPWTNEQLYGHAPVFNKHDHHFLCSFVVIVDTLKTGETDFYIAPPKELEKLWRPLAREVAQRPTRDGKLRKPFRKELPRERLKKWHRAWDRLGEPAFQDIDGSTI
jgi:hypothetical protein